MKIGIGFPARSHEQVSQYVETAREYPFESFIAYGDLGDLPPYLALGIFAHRLVDSEIQSVGPLGTPVGRMDAELIGSHARLFEQALGEKAMAGLVRGAFLEQISQRAAPLAQIEQSIDEVRKQAPATKIALGGFGPKLLNLASKKQVDYLKLGGSANVQLAGKVTSQFDEHVPKIILGAVTVVNENRHAARILARKEVAKYLNVVGGLDTMLNADQQESLLRFLEAYRNGQNAESQISGELLDAFSYSGTPDDIYQRVVDTHQSNSVDHIQFGTPHGLGNNQHGIRTLGEIARAVKEIG